MIKYISGISVAIAAVAVAVLFNPAGASAANGQQEKVGVAAITVCLGI